MKVLTLVMILVVVLPAVDAASYCGTVYTNEKDVVKDSQGRVLVKVDSNGNVFISSSSFSKNTNVPDNLLGYLLIKVGTAFKAAFGYSNSYLSGSAFESQNDLSLGTNSFSISGAGGVLFKVDSNGNIYSRGILAYHGAQAGCSPDGVYCNSNIAETIDYSCRASDAGCVSSIIASQTCGTSGCSNDYACNNQGTSLDAPYVNRGCNPSSNGGTGCYSFNSGEICSVPCSGQSCLADLSGYRYYTGCTPGSTTCNQATYSCNHASCISETTLRSETSCQTSTNSCGTSDTNCGDTSTSQEYSCSYDGNGRESLHWTHYHTCNPNSNSCASYSHGHSQDCGGPADSGFSDTGVCDSDSEKQQSQRHTCNSGTKSCSSWTDYQSVSCGSAYWAGTGCTGSTVVETHYHTCSGGSCVSGTAHSGHTRNGQNCASLGKICSNGNCVNP